jgi:hypothetical protein
MDTMTYASVAILPLTIAQYKPHFTGEEPELLPLDLSMIMR